MQGKAITIILALACCVSAGSFTCEAITRTEESSSTAESSRTAESSSIAKLQTLSGTFEGFKNMQLWIALDNGNRALIGYSQKVKVVSSGQTSSLSQLSLHDPIRIIMEGGTIIEIDK